MSQETDNNRKRPIHRMCKSKTVVRSASSSYITSNASSKTSSNLTLQSINNTEYRDDDVSGYINTYYKDRNKIYSRCANVSRRRAPTSVRLVSIHSNPSCRPIITQKTEKKKKDKSRMRRKMSQNNNNNNKKKKKLKTKRKSLSNNKNTKKLP